MTAPPAPPCPRTEAQVEASRRNGALSHGPATAEGKARSALNGTRHGLCTPRFFLLPDEDAQAFALFVADHLALLRPGDPVERQAAERAAQARWRTMRADRLEAEILAERFAAKELPDAAEARAVRAAQDRALATLLRYRARLQRDVDLALQEFAALRARQPAPAADSPARTSEPGPTAAAAIRAAARPPVPAAGPDLPGEERRAAGAPAAPPAWPPANRHERRRLAALRRKAA